MKTFQTVGMELSTWGLVEGVMARERLTLTEAMEKLVRLGTVRMYQLEEGVTR
jgi:hypothetical protein